jgi:hypothetical protein
MSLCPCPYQSPNRAWVKVKLRHESVFIVGGIRDVDAFDGALVGQRVGEDLHFRGVVEWGFRASDVLELLREAKYAPQRLSPFVDLPWMRNAVWLTPRFRAEISYAEIVRGQLRAPSWRGIVAR